MVSDERRANNCTNPAVCSPVWLPCCRWGLSLATAAYAAVLVFTTHYPTPEQLIGRPLPPDKLMHFVAYGVFGLLATTTLRAADRWHPRAIMLLLIALVLAAAGDEVTQPLFSRHADILDWIYDCIGIAIGMLPVILYKNATLRQPLH